MALTKVTGDMTSGIADESGLTSIQTFTSSGTWTKPSGITKVIVEVQAAGGSGAWSSASNNPYMSGAGGGGYAKKFLDVSSISSATITVGSGAAGVAQNNVGSDGGNSSWADGTNTITANGGGGGLRTQYYSGSGGTATGGDINIQGQYGFQWQWSWGGDSFMGHGGQFSYGDNNAWIGRGYGGGGSAKYDNFGVGNSGAGADGIVIITEYK